MTKEVEGQEAGVVSVRERLDSAVKYGIDNGDGPKRNKDWPRLNGEILDIVAFTIHEVEQSHEMDVAEAFTSVQEKVEGNSVAELVQTGRPVQLHFEYPGGALFPTPVESMGREIVGALTQRRVTEYVNKQSVGSGHALGEVGLAKPLAMAVYQGPNPQGK